MIDCKPVKRSCNRHDDCDKADEYILNKTGDMYVPIDFHCHDDECSECFGN